MSTQWARRFEASKTVRCPACWGSHRFPCKRCGGAGTLVGRHKSHLGKQNTGWRARLAWIKGGSND